MDNTANISNSRSSTASTLVTPFPDDEEINYIADELEEMKTVPRASTWTKTALAIVEVERISAGSQEVTTASPAVLQAQDRVRNYFTSPSSTLLASDPLLEKHRQFCDSTVGFETEYPNVEATLLTEETPRSTTVRDIKDGSLLEIVLGEVLNRPVGDDSWDIIVIEDPSTRVIQTVGGYLDIPFEFFLSHVLGGAYTTVNSELPGYWGTMDEHMNQIRASHGSDWIYHEWHRAGVLKVNPTREVEKGKNPDLTRSCLPWRMMRSVEEEADVKANVIRQFRTTGQDNDTMFWHEVVFRERISMCKSRVRNHCVVILVDKLAREMYRDVDAWPSLSGAPGDPEYRESTRPHIISQIQASLQSIHTNSPSTTSPPLDIDKLLHHVERHTLRSATVHWKMSLQRVNSALDDIDVSMSNDDGIARRVNQWRYLLGIWRAAIPKMRVELMSTKSHLQYRGNQVTSTSLADRTLTDDTVRTYSRLLRMCDSVQDRIDRSSAALMSTMSILESQNAIRQGGEVQKLTELAFIFIPMSFAASYFGMEIREWGESAPSLKSFWVLATALVFGMYALRITLHSSAFQTFKLHMSHHIIYDRAQRSERASGAIKFREIFIYIGLTNTVSSYLILSLLLAVLPVSVFWIFAPLHWPLWILLTASLVWLWLFSLMCYMMENMRWRGSATRWNSTGLMMGRIYVGGLIAFTVAYPILIVYVGGISAVVKWESRVKAGVAAGTSVGVLVAMMAGVFVVGSKPDIRDLKRRLI